METSMARIPHIPDSELVFTFVRSSGPGGQNVNKVNSKAVLRWSVLRSPSLSEEERLLLIRKLPVTVSGDLVIMSDRHRDQGRNREECRVRFREMLFGVFNKPKERKKTRPTRASQKKRRESKKRQSEKKALRRGRRQSFSETGR